MTEPATGEARRDPESSKQRAALLLACALILVWGINFSVLKAVLACCRPQLLPIHSLPIMPLCAARLCGTLRDLARLPRADSGHCCGWPSRDLCMSGCDFRYSLFHTASRALDTACGPVFTLLLLRVSVSNG